MVITPLVVAGLGQSDLESEAQIPLLLADTFLSANNMCFRLKVAQFTCNNNDLYVIYVIKAVCNELAFELNQKVRSEKDKRKFEISFSSQEKSMRFFVNSAKED